MEEENQRTEYLVAASGKNSNKLNGRQKDVLAQFMLEHPDLAKNKLQNCAQAKLKCQNLWRTLSTKLNAWGPPIKDVTSWRKVYADQKHNAKKKLSHNKESIKKTGGGPYEEKMLTNAEEQIVAAAGLTAAVAGLVEVKCFGGSKYQTSDGNNKSDPISELDSSDIDVKLPTTSRSRRQKKGGEKKKVELIEDNMRLLKDFQCDIGEKLDKLIDIKERSLNVKEKNNRMLYQLISLKEKDLQIKQMEHDANMASKVMDLKIKTIELEKLQENSTQRE